MRITLATALLLAACSGPATEQPEKTPDVAATPAADATPAPAPTPEAPPVAVKQTDEVLEFEYAYPGAAAAIPALKTQLDTDAQKQRITATAAAADDKKQSEGDGFPYRRHSFMKTWSVSTDTPQLLILESEGYTYTGGAHGTPFYEVIVWDKAAGKTIDMADLFTDWPKLLAAAKPDFCKALDAERAKRRGPDAGAIGGLFGDCPELKENPITALGKDGRITALRAIIGPYVAGPYAEGTYEIDLPLTAAVRGLVKPAYAASFSDR
ncbi:DUF4163 domain-containing protein [Allosphingosinicella indica]|uniref:Deacetylase PdaC domain-containing protein n=1 Tax=Allosphingosinicella indica TaxID=941907 RepID=A0A1X7FYZ4_9SPHN|nr:DUF4163 domain-containing protein [Allosphingosinicella indica]SMF61354.1 protein of unknown function [Allosphingosinicella indica]